MENRKTINRAKSALLVFILILIGIFMLLMSAGGDGEYAAEKALWRLVKDLDRLSVDSDHAPKVIFDDLNAKFELFYQKFPDSNLRPTALVKQAHIYILQKDYTSARDVIELMIQDYLDEPNIAVAGLAEIGRIFSLQNDVPAVVQTYRRIWEHYPLSDMGLTAPLSIVQLTTDPQSVGTKDKDFLGAEKFYQQLIVKKEEPFSFRAYGLLAQLYVGRQYWDDAFKIYQRLFLEYAETAFFTPPIAETVLRSMNTIGVSKIKDLPRLILVYQKFIEKYPHHPIIPTVRGILNSLEQMMERLAEEGALG